MPSHLRPLSFLLLLVGAILPLASSQDCQACLFDGNDADTCIIYGKLGDQVVEWNTGSRECKGFYSIAITSIDPTTSCMNANSFVNSLRFGDLKDSDSKLGLGVGSDGGAFFVTNKEDDRIDMADLINITGVVTNCAASNNDCYGAMKAYFEDNDTGGKEMQQVCSTLFQKVRLDRNLEESTLRIRLCTEIENGEIIPLDCNPLAVQVGDLVTANSDQNCSAYGFETPLSQVPGCKTAGSSSTTATSSGSTSASGGSTTSASSSGNRMSLQSCTVAFGFGLALAYLFYWA